MATELSDREGLQKPMYNVVATLASSFLIGSFLILAGNKDMHLILDEFVFQPDMKTDYGVSCP